MNEREFYKLAPRVFALERQRQKLTQSDLAAKTGFFREDISKYENGNRTLKSAAYAEFCAALGLSDTEVRRRVSEEVKTAVAQMPKLSAPIGFMSSEVQLELFKVFVSLGRTEREAYLLDVRSLYEGLKGRFPTLTHKDIPWLFQIFGDVLLQSNKFEEAAMAYTHAVDGYALRQIDARFQRARARQRHAMEVRGLEKHKLLEEALSELAQCFSLARSSSIDYRQYADYMKVRAEWQIDLEGISTQQSKEDFEDAIIGYRRAIERLVDETNKRETQDPSESKRRSAYCYINIGYCFDRLGLQSNAIQPYVDALILRNELGDDAESAYCFKEISKVLSKMAAEGVSEADGAALWSANAAVAIYTEGEALSSTENATSARISLAQMETDLSAGCPRTDFPVHGPPQLLVQTFLQRFESLLTTCASSPMI